MDLNPKEGEVMKTRSLTEGAMLGAITVLVTIIGEYLGLPAIIVPVPLILLVYRQGLQMGILTAVVAALISSLVAGHVFSGLSILIWGFVGVSVGMALREKFSFPKLITVGVLSNLVVIGLNIFLYSLIFGQNLFTEMLGFMIESMERAMSITEGLGMAGEAVVKYERMLDAIPFIFKYGLPSILLIYALVMSYINLLVIRLILKRMDDEVPWISPFVEWKTTTWFVLPLIAGMYLTGLAQTVSLAPWLQYLGLNMFILSFYWFLIIGIAIVWHYFRRKNVAKFLRFLFVLFLFSLEPLVLMVVFLAISDGIFDWRKLKATPDLIELEENNEEE